LFAKFVITHHKVKLNETSNEQGTRYFFLYILGMFIGLTHYN